MHFNRDYKFSLLISLIGLALLVNAGFLTKDVFVSNMLGVAGSAILGLGVGSIINVKQNIDILEVLRASSEHAFKTRDKEIDHYRARYHRYHLTTIDDKTFWRHTILDFSKSISPGVLVTTTEITGKSGNKVTYLHEGGKRGPHLIVFSEQKNGDEPASVIIFPFIGKNFSGVSFGVLFGENWDGKGQATKVILSKDALFNISNLGNVSENDAKRLDDLWSANFKKNMSFNLNT